MQFWQQINHGPGCVTDTLTADELARVRGLVTAQYLEQLAIADAGLIPRAIVAGIHQYHTLPISFDHGAFWTKERRVLPTTAAAVFADMGFFRRIREHLPTADVYADDLMWRVVRPGQPGDVGPVHADKWFWDAGNGSIPADRERFKIWIALYTEPGLNGLCVKPGSHKSDQWRRHFESRHGKLKPVLDESVEELKMELLPLEPGGLVMFHDELLHGGVVNRGAACRVSIELTVTHSAADGERLSSLCRAA